MRSAIKAVVVDLGGTLLDQGGNPYYIRREDATANVIRELWERGVAFGFVTGLSPPALNNEARSSVLRPYLKLATYAILENGAAIYRKRNSGISFDSDHLDQEWAGKIFAQSVQLDEITHRLEKEQLVFQRFDYSVRLNIEQNRYSESRVREVLAWRTESIKARLSHGQIIFCPAAADKGAAVQFIAQKEGWNLGDIMAIGNETGDESMLKIVGHPRAPANDVGRLKELVLERGGVVSELPAGQAVYQFVSSLISA